MGFDLSVVSVHGGDHACWVAPCKHKAAWECLSPWTCIGYKQHSTFLVTKSFLSAEQQRVSSSFTVCFKTLSRDHDKRKRWGYVQGCLALQRDLPLPSLQDCPAEEKANIPLGNSFRDSFLSYLQQQAGKRRRKLKRDSGNKKSFKLLQFQDKKRKLNNGHLKNRWPACPVVLSWDQWPGRAVSSRTVQPYPISGWCGPVRQGCSFGAMFKASHLSHCRVTFMQGSWYSCGHRSPLLWEVNGFPTRTHH